MRPAGEIVVAWRPSFDFMKKSDLQMANVFRVHLLAEQAGVGVRVDGLAAALAVAYCRRR